MSIAQSYYAVAHDVALPYEACRINEENITVPSP